MIRELTPSSLYMGLLAAFVGYSASFAIVLAGLTSMGANEAQASTGLFFATLGMGICSIWLPFVTRIPAAVAWSTPGAAFLAATQGLTGGFAEAVGAMIVCAGLILLTGVVPALGRIITAIPKPIANALLAGVLLKLCLAPALALGEIPHLFVPVLIAWLVGLLWNRLAAMPLAVITFVVVLTWSLDGSSTISMGSDRWLPTLEYVDPAFSISSIISIALPLYLVTMAGQNIPGFAVLELNNYQVVREPLIRKTGLISLLISPFGSIPVNMSAITAALMAGEDAGHEPSVRYWAAIVSGFAYVALAFIAVFATGFINLAPTILITGVAGLALIPAFIASISAAFAETKQLEAPALTFLIAGSGMTLIGVSGAFWGVLIGAVVWFAKSVFAKH